MGAAILTSDKTHCKTRAITRDKEGRSPSMAAYPSEETPNMKPKGHIHVHCSIICNSKDMKAIKVFINM